MDSDRKYCARNRRSFLKGVFDTLAAGVCAKIPGGGRLFAAPCGWRPGGSPNLVVGLVSDTHLRTARSRRPTARPWPDTFYTRALEYFRDANVDVVLHCGDMANYGEVEAIERHLEIWRRVFPKSKAPDGHKVELLAVSGNHDLEGQGMNAYVRNVYAAPDFRARHILAADVKKHWERIWGEKYENVWHKEIKGYHFFGRQWGVDQMETARQINELGPSLGLDKGCKPFFLVSHSRPFPPMRSAISRYKANALAFFGHSHISSTNWRTIYYAPDTFPRMQIPPCISPDWKIKFADGALSGNTPIQGSEATGPCRQGIVMRVYDNMLVFERREFCEGGSLGADWVMPLGKCAGREHPFSANALRKKIGTPQFRADAKLKAELAKSSAGADVVRLAIPHADGNPESRVYVYDVAITGSGGGETCRKTVYAAGCNMAVGHETNGGATTLDVPVAELPPGENVTFCVRPKTSLGTEGRPARVHFRRDGRA